MIACAECLAKCPDDAIKCPQCGSRRLARFGPRAPSAVARRSPDPTRRQASQPAPPPVRPEPLPARPVREFASGQPLAAIFFEALQAMRAEFPELVRQNGGALSADLPDLLAYLSEASC